MAAEPTWDDALRWLREDDHTSTVDNVAALKGYFTDHPEQLKVADWIGCLPLHFAAWFQRGEHAVAIVTFLLNAYPDGVRQKNEDGMLPLHIAANYQKGEHAMAIVTLLLAAYPAGAQQKDINGALPALYADKYNGTNLPASCIAMLRAAAESKWQPPAAPAFD